MRGRRSFSAIRRRSAARSKCWTARGAVLETRKLLLSDLQLAPLDVVFGVEPLAGVGQVSEIEQRVLYQARLGSSGFPQQARLRVQHARPADLGAQELTLLDVLEQARRVRRLLTTARAADSEDLNPPERGEAGDVNLTELSARVTKAEQALKAAHKALDTLVKKGAAATSDALRAALLKLGGFGFQAAVPVVAVGDDAAARAALNTQGIALLKESKARIARSRRADRRAGRRRASRATRATAGTDAHGLRLVVRCHAAVHVRQRRGAQERSGCERASAGRRRAERLHVVHACGACARPARALERAAERGGSARNRRESATEGRAAAVRCRRPVGGIAAGAGQGRAGRQALAGRARGRDAQGRSAAVRAARRRVGRSRAELEGNDRDRVPVQSAGCVRAAERAARGAAGSGSAVDGREPASCAASKRSTSRNCARSMPRRSARSGTTCRRCSSPSTRTTKSSRPTSRS